MQREQHEGRTLEVRLYGRRVGALSREGAERLAFRYDPAYARDPRNPPLSVRLPLARAAYAHDATYAWFDALLAEGVRRQHLARIVNAASLQTWELLHAAGGECAGAVQIVGEEHRAQEPRVVPLTRETLFELLEERPIEPIGSVDASARISLAGAQEKVALCRTGDGQWALPLGGHPSSHILKPQSTRFPRLVENEHYCMALARRCGLDAARTRVERVGDLAVLVVERYDRTQAPDGALTRIHQEDLAQALGATRKYQDEGGPGTYALFGVPGVARDALFDAVMFNWLVGNCDAHAKNYSVLEPGTANARLAPLYDVVCTECYEGLDRTLATRIGRASHLNAVNRDAVEALGARVGYARGEASRRLGALAHRLRGAVQACERNGLDPGPVQTNTILRRTDAAHEWAGRERE